VNGGTVSTWLVLRADLRHPALRLVSPQGTRRCSEWQAFEAQEPAFSIDDPGLVTAQGATSRPTRPRRTVLLRHVLTQFEIPQDDFDRFMKVVEVELRPLCREWIVIYVAWIQEVEANLGVLAVGVASAEGVLMVHPKLREEIHKQPDADVLAGISTGPAMDQRRGVNPPPGRRPQKGWSLIGRTAAPAWMVPIRHRSDFAYTVRRAAW
jgi:hypothetical protein